jgi:hypothetical protein
MFLHLISPRSGVLYVNAYSPQYVHVEKIMYIHHEVLSYDDLLYMNTISPSHMSRH